MPDSALLTVLTGTGACGVFCILFICGLIYPRSVVADKDRRIAELEAALKAKDEAAGVAIAAAIATRDIMTALQSGHGREPALPGEHAP